MKEEYFYTINPNGFYGSNFPGVMQKAKDEGLELYPISNEDYENFFNPPEGFVGVFDENGPRIEKIPPPNYVMIAEAERASLLEKATSAIIVWQTKLLMGRKLTSEESGSLNTWMDYIDELSAVDTSTAPDITWPVSPSK